MRAILTRAARITGVLGLLALGAAGVTGFWIAGVAAQAPTIQNAG